jgi:DNA polymerase-3 subunit epsilon
MSLFSWLRPASPLLSADLQQRLAKLPTIGELKECSLREQRWVVLDLETTGLNLNKDRVLSIGAVVIEDGASTSASSSNAPCNAGAEAQPQRVDPRPGPQRDCRRQRPGRSAAGTHGVYRRQPGAGVSCALRSAHARTRPEGALGYKLQNVFLDVADMAPLLCPQANIREAGLDEWIDWFKLEVFERHNASADALATAELALILFSRAAAADS